MKRPLSLSDRQLQLVRDAARSLLLSLPLRDQFLQGVAARLTGEPSAAAVTQAINIVLDRTPVFLNDSAPTKKGATP